MRTRRVQCLAPCSGSFRIFPVTEPMLKTHIAYCPECGRMVTIRINYKSLMTQIPAHNHPDSAREVGAQVTVTSTYAPLSAFALNQAFRRKS